MCVWQHYYFVDAHFISTYIREKDSAESNVKRFTEFPRNHFLYTETVRKQMLARGHEIPNIFQYVALGTAGEVRSQVLSELIAISNIDVQQREIFTDDFMMVYEASACSDWGLLPQGVQVPPSLLISHPITTKLLNNEAGEAMNKVLELFPIESVIQVLNFEDEWETSAVRLID